MGDPELPLKWVSKSPAKLADALHAQGHAVSPNTISKLLEDRLGYSRQVNRTSHPDRNAQFEHINAKVAAAMAAGEPVISVDTKKKELIGNYRNGGSDWRPKGNPGRAIAPAHRNRDWVGYRRISGDRKRGPHDRHQRAFVGSPPSRCPRF
jgi:hypothetical protein